MEKQFVATGFIVKEGKTLLLKHKKLGLWLPPGGHMEENETPEEAVRREILEETGLEAEILSAPAFVYDDEQATTLIMPHHMQVELIKHRKEPEHQHIDFIFFCKAKGEPTLNESEHHEMKWFSAKDLETSEITPNIRGLGKEAIEIASK